VSTDQQASPQPWSAPQDHDDVGPAPAQPVGSDIVLKRFDDGISIRVPPAGLWHGSRGLFAFSVVWNALILIITVGMLAAYFAVGMPAADLWVMVLVPSVLWTVGISLMLVGVNMGRREAGLAVAGGTLMVMQTGLFGTKQREWPLDRVASVGVGPSGITVNNVPVLQLQILDKSGSKLGLLAGRSDEELHWLARELRAAVRMSE
jgi:hypothetical protein